MAYKFSDYLKEVTDAELLPALNRTPKLSGFHKGLRYIGTFFHKGRTYAFDIGENGIGKVRDANQGVKHLLLVNCKLSGNAFVDVSYPY